MTLFLIVSELRSRIQLIFLLLWLVMRKTIIIVPTYNEKENIPGLIQGIFLYAPEVEILFVDDSSPDGTAVLIEAYKKKFPNQIHLEMRSKKEGLGRAYVHGFRWALAQDYDCIFEMDADLSHPAAKLPEMLSQLDAYDVVIGSRYLKGVNVVNWPLMRMVLSVGASLYVQLITGLKIKDTTAGFVGYTRAALSALDLDKIAFVGYAFQIEMKFRLWKKGFTMIEIPIVFTNREKGSSKMNGSIIWEAIFGVIYLKFASIFKRL